MISGMGTLVQRIIKELNNTNGIEDFGDSIWMAGALIRRSFSSSYNSGFEAIDREDVSEAEPRRYGTRSSALCQKTRTLDG